MDVKYKIIKNKPKKLKKGECEIKEILIDWGNDEDKILHIPEEIEGCKVASINLKTPMNTVNKEIEEVYFPSTIRYIEEATFFGCTSLKCISLPSTPISIGQNAFSNTAYYNDKSNWEKGFLYIGNHLIKIKDIDNINIKEDCVDVASYALCFGSAEELELPFSLRLVSECAFHYCNIKQVFLNSGVILKDLSFNHLTTDFLFLNNVEKVESNPFQGANIGSIHILNIENYIKKFNVSIFNSNTDLIDKSGRPANIMQLNNSVVDKPVFENLNLKLLIISGLFQNRAFKKASIEILKVIDTSYFAENAFEDAIIGEIKKGEERYVLPEITDDILNGICAS